MIKIDLSKAVEIRKEQLRIERAPLLQHLDVQFQLAGELGDSDKYNAVVAEKKRLRKITDLCNQAKTTEELKNITVFI